MKRTLANSKTTSHTTMLDELKTLHFSYGRSWPGASTRQRGQQALVAIGPTRYYHSGLDQEDCAALILRVPSEISASVQVRLRSYGMLSHGA
jgi:hypothetical protein